MRIDSLAIVELEYNCHKDGKCFEEEYEEYCCDDEDDDEDNLEGDIGVQHRR